MRNNRFFFVILAFFTVLFSVSINPLPSSAQSILQWSPPQRIRGIADDSDPPYLVSDQDRTVHAFNSQWTGNEFAIFYSKWSPGRVWTVQNDILLSPNAHQATVLGAFLDQKGFLHVAFFGGTQFGAEIYYSKAPAINAAQAQAWAPPKMVGSHAGGLISGALAADDRGNLFIVYSGDADGNGLYEVHSIDGGDTWSAPSTVFLTDSSTRWAFAIRAALDSESQLHVVWTVKNRLGTGDAVYYARMQSDHRGWSFPVTLQETKGGDYQADWASIVSYQGELSVIYDYGLPPRLWMQRSSNSGKTWTDPTVMLPSLVGETGHSLFLVDSNNSMHLITAKRTSDNRLGGIWHSERINDRWGEAEPVATGPASSTKFAPSRPTGVISQGNILLVTWRQDPGLSTNGVWYSYATLNAPELPMVGLPTPVVTSTPIPYASATPTSSVPGSLHLPQPVFTPGADGTLPPLSESNASMGILIAILPVVLILAVVAVTRNRR